MKQFLESEKIEMKPCSAGLIKKVLHKIQQVFLGIENVSREKKKRTLENHKTINWWEKRNTNNCKNKRK